MRQKDIAKQLNISSSTVSRVLNNIPKAASEELTKEIWRIAHESNYQFNEIARSLKTQTNPTSSKATNKKIACFYARDPFTSSFFASLERGFEHEALRHGYSYLRKQSLLDITMSDFKLLLRDYANYPFLILGRVPQSLLGIARKIKNPIVQAGINANCNNFDRVISNGFSAASMIVQFLNFFGHRNIVYFGEVRDELRFYGYHSAILSLDLPFQVKLSVFECIMSKRGGYEACSRFLEFRKNNYFVKKTSAIFCANDETAIGVYAKLEEENLSIPEDLSIISIDNIDEIDTLNPLLTTMKIPTTEIGKVAALTLISRIEGFHHIPMKIELPSQLIIRKSVKDYNNNSSSEIKKFKNLFEFT